MEEVAAWQWQRHDSRLCDLLVLTKNLSRSGLMRAGGQLWRVEKEGRTKEGRWSKSLEESRKEKWRERGI